MTDQLRHQLNVGDRVRVADTAKSTMRGCTATIREIEHARRPSMRQFFRLDFDEPQPPGDGAWYSNGEVEAL